MYREKQFQYPSFGQQGQAISLAIFFIAATATFVWSITQIQKSYVAESDHKVEEYLKDERQWNETFLKEFKSINLSVIKDAALFDQIQSQISWIESNSDPE